MYMYTYIYIYIYIYIYTYTSRIAPIRRRSRTARVHFTPRYQNPGVWSNGFMKHNLIYDINIGRVGPVGPTDEREPPSPSFENHLDLHALRPGIL